MTKTSAYIGIAGALGMAACDIILLGQPVSGSYYDLSSFGALEQIDSIRVLIGSTLGLVCDFFICFGFWHLKRKFEAVDERLSMALFISLSSMMFFAGAFHAGYYFLSNTGMLSGRKGFMDPAMISDFRSHLEILSYLGVPGFIAGAILFFKLALHPKFPAWYKYCNPLVLSGVFLGLLYFLPAPVGGYIRPAFINLATASLFIVSLCIGKRQGQNAI